MTTATARRGGGAPDPATLDPAERMGVDELRVLQLERLRATLCRAFEHVPQSWLVRSGQPVGGRATCCTTPTGTASSPVVARLVKDTVGTSVDVAVVDPETLERSVGKLKRLVDLRDRA